MQFFYYLFLFCAILQAAGIVFASARIYTFLNFWLIGVESKLEFIQNNPMLTLAVMNLHLMQCFPALMIPAVTLAISPTLGLVSFFCYIIFIIFCKKVVHSKFGEIALNILIEDARAVVERRKLTGIAQDIRSEMKDFQSQLPDVKGQLDALDAVAERVNPMLAADAHQGLGSTAPRLSTSGGARER